jgi:hypothetical protein
MEAAPAALKQSTLAGLVAGSSEAGIRPGPSAGPEPGDAQTDDGYRSDESGGDTQPLGENGPEALSSSAFGGEGEVSGAVGHRSRSGHAARCSVRVVSSSVNAEAVSGDTRSAASRLFAFAAGGRSAVTAVPAHGRGGSPRRRAVKVHSARELSWSYSCFQLWLC